MTSDWGIHPFAIKHHQVHWESFNQWQCFSKEQLYFECVNYDENTLVPSIRVETDVESLFFDLHVEDNFACEETLAIWDDLFQGGAEFCVYAAHMKSFDLDKDEESQKVQTLWYIEKLKGHSGYWDIYKPQREKSKKIENEIGNIKMCRVSYEKQWFRPKVA